MCSEVTLTFKKQQLSACLSLARALGPQISSADSQSTPRQAFGSDGSVQQAGAEASISEEPGAQANEKDIMVVERRLESLGRGWDMSTGKARELARLLFGPTSHSLTGRSCGSLHQQAHGSNARSAVKGNGATRP